MHNKNKPLILISKKKSQLKVIKLCKLISNKIIKNKNNNNKKNQLLKVNNKKIQKQMMIKKKH